MARKKALRKFTKHDDTKSALDLLPAGAIELVGQALRIGKEKYSADNWRGCKDPSRFLAANLRHLMKHMRGEFLDRESHLPHLAHAICSGLFTLELYLAGRQDRFVRGNYFALIRKRSKRRGVIVKRFRTYDKAWQAIEDLDLNRYLIKTVPASEKVGTVVRIL